MFFKTNACVLIGIFNQYQDSLVRGWETVCRPRVSVLFIVNRVSLILLRY